MGLIQARRALICGVSGQDGAYLAHLLLEKGYEVWGTSRNSESHSFSGLKKIGIYEQVKLLSMAPESFNSVARVFSYVRPSEIYNLTGQSSVGVSFEKPMETIDSIAKSTINQLEAIRILDKSIRFYNAGSSECFGDTGGKSADESTPFNPCSPYGVAKAAATWQVKTYRDVYGLFACTGILFNHESPLRDDIFVTKKIINAVYRLAHGSKEKLKLGNILVSRDWGWAPEYVEAMWRMLNYKIPEDFIIATGVTQSLSDFIRSAFEEVNMDWKDYVIVDDELQRLSDYPVSAANPAKAEKLLSWKSICNGSQIAKRLYREIENNNNRNSLIL
jgi:GDPmannose 4,6-dehydratase